MTLKLAKFREKTDATVPRGNVWCHRMRNCATERNDKKLFLKLAKFLFLKIRPKLTKYIMKNDGPTGKWVVPLDAKTLDKV